ncbi:MAG: hypothetical protein R3F61_12130 [Myxococcota bacterium]
MSRSIPLLLALFALHTGCAPSEPVRSDADARARTGLPDKLATDEELDVVGRHRARPSGRIAGQRLMGGQEGEPVWSDGLNDIDIDADPPPAPPGDPSDTADTGM